MKITRAHARVSQPFYFWCFTCTTWFNWLCGISREKKYIIYLNSVPNYY